MILEWFIRYDHVVQYLLNTCLSSVCSKSTSNHHTVLLDRLLPLVPLIRGHVYPALMHGAILPTCSTTWVELCIRWLAYNYNQGAHLVINRLEYDRLQGTTMEYNLVDAKDHVTRDHMAVVNNHVTMANDKNAMVNNKNDVTKKYMTKYQFLLAFVYVMIITCS